jgi:hypothetical protein
MRLRIKLSKDNLPETLAISADNLEEREMVREIYDKCLSLISKLNGKAIQPYDKQETQLKRIASIQSPTARDKKGEGLRKARATLKKNRAARGT